jgi:hypothetical protein
MSLSGVYLLKIKFEKKVTSKVLVYTGAPTKPKSGVHSIS